MPDRNFLCSPQSLLTETWQKSKKISGVLLYKLTNVLSFQSIMVFLGTLLFIVVPNIPHTPVTYCTIPVINA
jgi:hypothetical protein